MPVPALRMHQRSFSTSPAPALPGTEKDAFCKMATKQRRGHVHAKVLGHRTITEYNAEQQGELPNTGNTVPDEVSSGSSTASFYGERVPQPRPQRCPDTAASPGKTQPLRQKQSWQRPGEGPGALPQLCSRPRPAPGRGHHAG